MDLEKYVLDEYLNKVIKKDKEGKQYVLEKDIDSLHLNAMERKFVFQIMDKYHIECKLDVIKEEDRPTKVSDFEYGNNIDSNLESRDVPRYAVIEYDYQGNLVKEDYTELDKFLEEEFLPDNVIMTKRKNKKDKEFVGYIDTVSGRRKKYERELYPSVQLNKIVKLKLSDREYKHVLKYLEDQDILVRGKDSTIDQEFENYDYYVTYKNEILPAALTKEDNYQKFVLYSKTKDPVLREQLILGNLRLVPYVAWGFAIAYDKDISEIESYGYEGLIEAVDRYDYTKGATFASYAIVCIRNKIKDGRKELDYINRNEWADSFYRNRKVVESEQGEKLSENMDLVYDVVELMMKEGELKLQSNPNAIVAIRPSKDPDKLREQIEENVKRIKFLYSKNLDDFVLDSELDMDDIDDVNSKELMSDYNVEDDVVGLSMMKDVHNVLSVLTPRERKVIEFRFGFEDGKTHSLDETANLIGVSRERVRQIEAKALRKLRHPKRSRLLKDYTLGDEHYKISGDLQELKEKEINSNNDMDDTVGVMMDDKWIEDWKKVTSEFKKKR